MQRRSVDVCASLVFVISLTVLVATLFLTVSACKVSRSLGADPADVVVRRPSDPIGEIRDGSLPRPSVDAGETLDGSLPRPSDDAGELPDGSLAASAAPCWDPLTSRMFRRALCICRDATLGSGGLLVDAFDSSEGRYSAADPDIHVAAGVNGVLEIPPAPFKVSGDLTVTSLDGLTLPGSVHVLGDLRVRGTLRCSGQVRIEGDAWLEGGYQGIGALSIGGDRIMPPAASTTSSVSVGGNDRREPIAIEPPCACDGADVPDFATAIRRAQTENDNAANGFDSGSLRDIDESQDVPLAGRVYSTGLRVSGALTQLSLLVDDKVSLFIDGDLVVEGGLQVELAAAGELDVYVAGRLTLSGLSRVGSVEQPARVRVYVASEGVIDISPIEVGANLYAPRASVVLKSSHALYGSVFVQDFTSGQTAAIHYDAAGVRRRACAPGAP